MRATILALLGLNMLFLIWQFFVPAPEPAFVSALPDVPLVREFVASPVRPAEPLGEPEDGQHLTAEEADSRVDDAGLAPLIAAPRPESLASGRCAMIGPLRDGDAARVRNALSAHVAAQMVERELERVTMYRVYIAATDRVEAERYQLQLRQRLAEDGEELASFIIGAGELSGHLSLGVFRQASNAQQWQARIETLGFPARVHDIVERENRQWLRVELQQDATQPVINRGALTAISDLLGYEENLCETIAPR